MTTAAHYQSFRLNATLHLWIPEHEPREDDPHYHIFVAAKKKLHELDPGCWRCGVKIATLKLDKGKVTEANPLAAKQIEIHHSKIEFSLANAIDVDQFKKDFPEFDISDNESFLSFVESEGNLLSLCDVCHRSPTDGIHFIPEPLWKVRRVWRKDLPELIQNRGEKDA